jgi:peptidoglycan/LPS O-acetylase OafA/YrhL
MYGGLQAGFGVFCLLAGFRREWTRPGLTAIACVMGGLVLMRCIAMGIHGPAGANPGAAIYEGITTALALLALARLPRAV